MTLRPCIKGTVVRKEARIKNGLNWVVLMDMKGKEEERVGRCFN